MDPLRDDDPRTLGPFTLRGRLGAGGMGVVYLAETGDGVQVAVKTVPRGVGDDVRVRLQREATLLRTIDHPRIARFVDADADADEPWLAMRYVSGPSLSDASLPLPPQQLRQLADGLAEALAALHKLGVTHRDVKPGNIIMTTHGAVLVDLGIAVTADAASMTMAGTAVGSPAWMAPEQFAGDPAGPAADVWGWAAVLIYAATGHEPFGTGTLTALAHRIMTQPPDLRGVPDWLLGPVGYALAKQPERRPSAQDLTRGGRARVAVAAGMRPPGVAGPAGPMGPGVQAPPWARGPQGPPIPGRAYPGGPPVGPYPGGAPSGPHPAGGYPPRTPAPSGPHALPPTHPSGPQAVGPRGAAHVSGTQAVRPAGSHRGSRRRPVGWIVGAALAVVAVAVTLAVVLIHGSGSGPTRADSTGPTAASGAITVDLLKQNGLCTGGCVITGRVSFTHPRWGKVTLVSTQATADGSTSAIAYLAVFDSHQQMQWSYKVGPVYTLKPVSSPVDALNHIFLSYNPGRYAGVIVLSADDSTQGMTDYASVPYGTDLSGVPYYDAAVKKVDSRYEIVVEHNDCTPDCASGTVSYTTYAWNGSDYAPKN